MVARYILELEAECQQILEGYETSLCPAVLDIKEYMELLQEELEGCMLPEESEAECLQAEADYEMYLESMEGE